MLQSILPDGATLLGVILSSDKTNISVMTGDRIAHPVLLSLANIRMDVRMKSSSHAFVLTALLPCPKFLIKIDPPAVCSKIELSIYASISLPIPSNLPLVLDV